mmetsp:Transcript_26936/g.61814  ORF Transcript_26936/g.61814 Transcript_26936/m.61814 type:complete len:104 (-) Transcript_26936:884-1195(-)
MLLVQLAYHHGNVWQQRIHSKLEKICATTENRAHTIAYSTLTHHLSPLYATARAGNEGLIPLTCIALQLVFRAKFTQQNKLNKIQRINSAALCASSNVSAPGV